MGTSSRSDVTDPITRDEVYFLIRTTQVAACIQIVLSECPQMLPMQPAMKRESASLGGRDCGHVRKHTEPVMMICRGRTLRRRIRLNESKKDSRLLRGSKANMLSWSANTEQIVSAQAILSTVWNDALDTANQYAKTPPPVKPKQSTNHNACCCTQVPFQR